MNPTTTDLATLLTSWTLGTNMFIGELKDTPDNSICLYDTGGTLFSDINRNDRKPRVMIHVRGSLGAYTESHAQANAIISTLHSKHNIYVGSTRYISIFAITEPLWLGYDSKDRPMWSINFEINRTE